MVAYTVMKNYVTGNWELTFISLMTCYLSFQSLHFWNSIIKKSENNIQINEIILHYNILLIRNCNLLAYLHFLF